MTFILLPMTHVLTLTQAFPKNLYFIIFDIFFEINDGDANYNVKQNYNFKKITLAICH
jgi:hypothetical protein